MNLLKETLDLLRADSRSIAEIARESGLGKEWLTKLSQGVIMDPGVSKIERLNAFLKSENQAA